MHLNLFLAGTGHHEASWRHPLADPVKAASADHYVHLARQAEVACLDSVFVADSLCTAIDIRHSMPRNFEPISLLSVIASGTSTIGLIGTMSTSYTEPYNLARHFASLDHISFGRAGWNIVTTAEVRAAQNFGQISLDSHEIRYERAGEFVDVVKKLWDSWDERAVIADSVSGVYAEDTRIGPVNHRGKHFSVDGPLNIARSPQRYPLLVQAGTSPAGQRFAATHADVVFTVVDNVDRATAFYRSLKNAVASCGRNPTDVKILPGLVPIIGETESSARRLAGELADLIVTRRAVAALEERLGLDLRGHDLDAPLPRLPQPGDFPGQQGRYMVIKELAEEGISVREMLRRLGGGRGHYTVVGDPEQVADRMQEWFLNDAADGFTILPPLLPETFDCFVNAVVPELQRRGLVRDTYATRTLRGHYGVEVEGQEL